MIVCFTRLEYHKSKDSTYVYTTVSPVLSTVLRKYYLLRLYLLKTWINETGGKYKVLENVFHLTLPSLYYFCNRNWFGFLKYKSEIFYNNGHDRFCRQGPSPLGIPAPILSLLYSTAPCIFSLSLTLPSVHFYPVFGFIY